MIRVGTNVGTCLNEYLAHVMLAVKCDGVNHSYLPISLTGY